jgi:ribonuclease E
VQSAKGPTLESEVRRRLTSAPGASAADRSPSPRRSPAHDTAAAAPTSLLSVARDAPVRRAPETPTRQPQAAKPETAVARTEEAGSPPAEKSAPAAAPAADAAPVETKGPATPVAPNAATMPSWSMAAERGFAPVQSGGWRYRAPVPPAKPWRERAEAPESATSGG